MLVLGMGISAPPVGAESAQQVSPQPALTDIELAISAVNEVQALNDGLLDARTGVFHPKVKLPSPALEAKGALSKFVQ